MQNIILAIAATNTPEQARIDSIYLKQGVDYFAFESSPDVDGGVIDGQEPRLASSLRTSGRNGSPLCPVQRHARPQISPLTLRLSLRKRLPTIWLIHDEFAEWMLSEDYKEAVSTTVQRLGIKARAAGILIPLVCTAPRRQRHAYELLCQPGQPTDFTVDLEGTSKIALGEKGGRTFAWSRPPVGKIGGRERTLLCPRTLRRPLIRHRARRRYYYVPRGPPSGRGRTDVGSRHATTRARKHHSYHLSSNVGKRVRSSLYVHKDALPFLDDLALLRVKTAEEMAGKPRLERCKNR